MLKRILRIALTPIMLIARITLGLAAFITSIASSVIGLVVGVFLLLSVVEFTIRCPIGSGTSRTGSSGKNSKREQLLEK